MYAPAGLFCATALAGSRPICSAHMGCMDKLLASLTHLAANHPAVQARDFDALLGELKTVLADFTPVYAYRARMSWDTVMGEHGWFDPGSEASASILAGKGHQVEARLAGDWIAYPPVVPA